MTHIGIDLGTTNSEIAIIRDGKPALLTIDGSCLVPSVFSIAGDGDILIGSKAVNNELLALDTTVRWVKRLMGSGKTIRVGEQNYSPAEISGRILAYLKQAAEQALGEEVNQAVITVPAFFGESAREDTRLAAESAGLEVLRLLNEPTAAAAAYAMGQRLEERWLIFDLGGGTFDVSIVDCSQDVMEVLASHGDTQLGGHDIDQLLAEQAAEAFQEQHGIDLRAEPTIWQRVINAAEIAKIQLSTEPYAIIRDEYLTKKDGIDLHLEHRIDRTEFETLIRPLLERTLTSVRQAMAQTNCTAGALTRVILVGGATRIPLVSQILRDELLIEPQGWLDPDRVVARGAAIEAAALAGDSIGAEMVDITPHSLGTKVLGDHDELTTHILIHRNTPLPCVASQIFYKLHPDQDQIEVDVLQGESPNPRKNKLLGSFPVTGLAASSAMEIHFRFDLDRSGLLQVSVEHLGSGASASKVIERSNAVRRADMRELPAVRLNDQDIGIENDEQATVVPFPGPISDASYVTIDEDSSQDQPAGNVTEAAAAKADDSNAELFRRAEVLLHSGELDSEDSEDLRLRLADAVNGGEQERGNLADLLYFLE